MFLRGIWPPYRVFLVSRRIPFGHIVRNAWRNLAHTPYFWFPRVQHSATPLCPSTRRL